MADKPSRALVLYGDGLARSISPTQTHLHTFASRAYCGFMALPNAPPSENEDARIIREFAELVDANEAFENLDVKSEDKNQKPSPFPSIGERFMGMKAAIITDNLGLKYFGDALGFKVFQWNEICSKTHCITESPLLASDLLKLLGFQDGKTQENFLFDLVFVHLEASKNENGLKDLEFLDRLVGDLLHTAGPETDVGSRLHMSVVLSYGATSGDSDLEFSFVDAKSKSNAETLPFYPRQSYMMKSGKPRENIRQHCPMLLAQYQKAVTRVDMVKSFSFRDFVENGGNLVIPADRFLHEVAFKLWKAPKYGA
ncbi:hypothetical protein STAS_08613 [Striga asiatica]|uniref:Uncharacterized protein n=1 Tax=Striga asiatica TaxID=4170 RepID=A0A5A7PIW5_STRAF|nr:hypothetical protein STAS_08613 [Striga asiatica]